MKPYLPAARVVSLAGALVALFPAAVLAATPTLSSAEQRYLVADQALGRRTHYLSLWGNNLPTPNADLGNTLWIRWADGVPHLPDNQWHQIPTPRTPNNCDAWVCVPAQSYSAVPLNIHGLDKEGWLQLAACDGAMNCSFLSVQVLPRWISPPVTGTLYPSSFELWNSTMTSNDRYLQFYPQHTSGVAFVYVSGPGFSGPVTSFGRRPWDDDQNGVGVYLPLEVMKTPGTYNLYYGNDFGWATPVSFTVRYPLLKISPIFF